MDPDIIEEILDRLLGAKVCLEEIMGIEGLSEMHMEAFDAALEAALEIEAGLTDASEEEE